MFEPGAIVRNALAGTAWARDSCERPHREELSHPRVGDLGLVLGNGESRFLHLRHSDRVEERP